MAANETPADTRMMGIVHAALKRDLSRVGTVLRSSPSPAGRQRSALAAHVLWMMEFLHAHHVSEDEGLWPVVRQRSASASGLLDSLEADHRMIGPAAEALTAAATRYRDTTTEKERADLVAALGALTTVLFPHLDREVEQAMPVVSACMTHAEWRAVEQAYNIKAKSFSQLGIEGQWLLDGIDAAGYRVVTQTVPTVARLVLLYGFGRRYRRQARERWEPDPSPTVAGRR